MTIKELCIYGKNLLNKHEIEDSNFKVRILLCYILNKNKTEIIANQDEEVNQESREKYIQCVKELINGKPLQYITKSQEFMGINFYVDENVLIPQPDTEVLVEETVKEVSLLVNKKPNNTIRILDLCTGSGAIAISIAKQLKENINEKFEIYGTDISKKALEIAKKNAVANDVQVKFILSDMFEKIEENKFDIIVSNPPYIETNLIKTLEKEVQNEPHLALDGGKDGLDFYRTIAKNVKRYLKDVRNNFIGNRV